jgi:pimeloyl-ACP methyl ester carboxylesterase
MRVRTENGAFTDVVAEQATINVGAPGSQRPELLARWAEIAHDVGPEGFLRQLSVQASRGDARSSLAAVAVPTLVLSGAADTVCPPEVQADLAGAIPGAVQVTVDDAGHMALIDSPSAVAAALRTWFEDDMTSSDGVNDAL